MDTLRRSKTPRRWWPQIGKWRQTRKHKYVFTILIYSWRCNFSMKRQQFYRLVSFAQNTDIQMSGWKVKNHIWPKMGILLLAKRTTSYLLSYQDCPHLPAARLPHRDQRISQIIPVNWKRHQIVTSMHAGNRCWQTLTSTHPGNRCCKTLTGLQREPLARHTRQDEQGGSNARNSWVVAALHRKSRGPGDSCASTFLWKTELRFGRFYKSGLHKSHGNTVFIFIFRKTEITTYAWGPKLRSSLPKTPTRIYSGSRKFGDLITADHKIIKWGRWISEQSSTRCRGTRSDPSMDTTIVRPKLRQRRRTVYASFLNRHRSQK